MRLGALSLLLLASAAAAEQPLAAYPGTALVRIGDDLVIGGEYYRLGYFTTPDAPAKVAEHFSRAFKEAGYPVTLDGDFVQHGVVSAFYTRQGLVRSVVLRRHDGRTFGFSVLKDVWVKAEAKPDRLPKLEGALYANELLTRSEAGGSQHRTAVLPVALQAARDARDAAWKQSGWSLVRESRVKREDDGKTQAVLEYSRGAEQAMVTLVDAGEKATAMDETWVGSSRADAIPNDGARKGAK